MKFIFFKKTNQFHSQGYVSKHESQINRNVSIPSEDSALSILPVALPDTPFCSHIVTSVEMH